MQGNGAVAQACLICCSESLRRIIGYEALPRVSSDSKPWPPGGTLVVCASCGTKQKIPDNAFKQEISKIYDNYEIYHQSEGAEQPIFDLASGNAAPRSKKLMASLTEMLSLPQTGRILDFGCGTGVAMRNFAKLRPAWELSGAELSASSLPFLRRINGFKTLYTCEATEIPETFDIITLIHSLEHVLEPVQTLSSLRDRLNPGGPSVRAGSGLRTHSLRSCHCRSSASFHLGDLAFRRRTSGVSNGPRIGLASHQGTQLARRQ